MACPSCEADVTVPASSHSLLNQYLATLIKAQEQRAKLFNLFGVKQEYFLHVSAIQQVQTKLLEFMRISLCADDRSKLEEFMATELAPYMEQAPMMALDVVSQEIS